MDGETLPTRVVHPGHIVVPSFPSRLAAVVASGVVLTLYDRSRCCGGLSYYTHPIRKQRRSGAMFAAPAVVRLYELLHEGGSEAHELEASLFGGAVNPRCARFDPGLSEANVNAGLELLKKLRISCIGMDVGGTRGRKIVFHTGIGETFVAKVDTVRTADWYPPYDPSELEFLEKSTHVPPIR